MAGGTVLPPQFAQLEAYWQALRPAPDALPRRADFDPRGIAGLLHATMLLERIAPGQVRIRLAGMALCDLLGMDLRGMPLSALLVPGARDALAGHLEQVFDGPAIAHLRLAGERGMMRPALAGDMLILPMCGQSGATDRALACLVTEGSLGRAPRRFEITGALRRAVPGLGAAPTPTPGKAAVPKVTPAPQDALPGLAEAPAPFAPAPASQGSGGPQPEARGASGAGPEAPSARKAPHLRLIRGGADPRD